MNNTLSQRLDYDLLASLIKQLDSLLENVVKAGRPSIRTDEVRAFLSKHRAIPGFKAVAVTALLEAEERLAQPPALAGGV